MMTMMMMMMMMLMMMMMMMIMIMMMMQRATYTHVLQLMYYVTWYSQKTELQRILLQKYQRQQQQHKGVALIERDVWSRG